MMPKIELGSLPIWYGPQIGPEYNMAPVTLTHNEFGLLMLVLDDAVANVIDDYYEGVEKFHTAPPGSSDWANRLADSNTEGIEKLLGRLDGKSVLEVGGANLYCARQMVRKLGAKNVTLIDPAAAETPDMDSLAVRKEYFTADTGVQGKFDVVAAFNVLEHIPDPVGFLQNAHAHLVDDGIVVIKVPDCEESLRKGDLGVILHQHILYFTMASLDVALQRAGFERVATANYAGALQVAAKKAKARPDAYCSSDPDLLQGFDLEVRRHVERLQEFAGEHKGERCAFIGASVGLCNVLLLSDIAAQIDISIYDSNSYQTGRFVPGIERAVMHISDRSLEQHDNIFIAPMNYFEEIRSLIEPRLNNRSAVIRSVFG